MWNLVESAVSTAMPEKRFEKGIDRFHVTERFAESLKALRDPFRVIREITLNDWRSLLENSDDAVEEIERLLTKELARQKRKKQISTANAAILRTHLTYINNNKQYMRYATLRKKCIPTGSGSSSCNLFDSVTKDHKDPPNGPPPRAEFDC